MMKKTSRFLMFVLTIFTVLLGACSGTAAPVTNVGSDKAQALSAVFTGLVENIIGNQWIINGQTVTVDPTVVHDGPFNVGDQVKLEGVLNQDGSFTVSLVDTPSAQDLSRLPQFGGGSSNDANSNDGNDNDDNNDNSNINDNANDANSNDENVNDDNGNDDNSNDENVNDDDNDSNDNGDDSSVNDNTDSGSDDDGGNSSDSGG